MAKRCRNCKKTFNPVRYSTEVVCSINCAIEHARSQSGKKLAVQAKRKAHREAKEKLKSKGDWKREAQNAFNRFVRLRDKGKPCISCDAPDTGAPNSRDCSHYRSIGACPELRFEELNAHASCKRCNNQLSGNIVEYRIRLVDRIGADKLEWLEGPHELTNYTIDDYKEIKKLYQKKAKTLN